ncbi:zinc knuckle CX2CX4HX4C [Artemisia annua]|uniref:Zinc knuckle CX2CX4HX4C n=1 Tax=Artemisia annua TaxID=35608 RepID=A0A2U1LH17_ARTAN|nr:zinc knuckle CX2CX4HX4C [Artemisia annua]
MLNNRPKRKTKRSTKYEDFISDSVAGKTNKNSSDNSGVIGGEEVSDNGDVQETMRNESMGNGGSDCVSGQVENTASNDGIEEQVKVSDELTSNGVSVSDVVVTKDCDQEGRATTDLNAGNKDDADNQASQVQNPGPNDITGENNESTEQSNGDGSKNKEVKRSYASVANNRQTFDKKLLVIQTEIDVNGTEIVVALASRVGKPLVMDNETASMCQLGVGRMGFARVLFEMTATKEVPEIIEVVYKNGLKEEVCRKKVKVVYDWNPPRCSTCCVFGHTTQKCGKSCTVDEPSKPKEMVENIEKDNNDGFVKVKKRNNGKGGDSKNQQQNENGKREGFKPAARFEYQPKPNKSGNTSKGNVESNEQVNNRARSKNNVGSKSPEKKAWKVGNEVVSALRKSANKYSVLGMYDENDQSELEDIRSREIVEEFIRQKKEPTDEEFAK